MRKLTLDEKITLKGLLARKPGFSGPTVAKAGMRDILFWWRWCYGSSITDYAKIRPRRVKCLNQEQKQLTLIPGE